MSAKPKPASRSTWWKTTSRSRMKRDLGRGDQDLARRALERAVGVLGPEAGQLRRRGRPRCARRRRPARRTGRSAPASMSASRAARLRYIVAPVPSTAERDERDEAVAVAGHVGEHVAARPALAQRRAARRRRASRAVASEASVCTGMSGEDVGEYRWP